MEEPPAAGRARSAFARRRDLALVFLVGVLLQLPTLSVGFFADDYVHQLVLEDGGTPTPIPRWSLYDFGSAEDWADFGVERGALPWWTSSDWRIRFFRPLASLSIRLDHALWGSRAQGYHFTNLVLWLALLALVHRLYRVFGLGAGAATIGLFAFVLSDASSVPVGWIANRNSLLEAIFAAGAVIAASGGRAWGALGLAFAAGLSKESGVFALLLVAADLHWRGRERPALAASLLFFAHIAFLVLAGYGTRSLFYATPWSDPGRYLANLFTVGSAGILSFLGPFPLDLVAMFPAARLALITAGCVVAWPLALWILRRVPRVERRLPILWTVLFLLPQGSVVPADRLLFVPSIGVAALLALAWSAERARGSPRSRIRSAGGIVLALSVTLGSGLSLLAQNADTLPGMARHLRVLALATDVGPSTAGRREVLVLQSESQLQAFTLGTTWFAEGGARDVRFWVLQSGPRPVRWTRIDDRTFELETLGRPFLDGPFERVYLSEAKSAVGQRWTTPLLEVEATAVDETGLRSFRVSFDRSLDSTSLRFVRPVDGVLTAIAAPPIGATIDLPEAVPTRAFVP